MSVYLDELFVINLIACLFFIEVMKPILPITHSRKRLLAAAAAGAAAACLRFVSGIWLFAALDIAVPLIVLRRATVPRVVLFELIKYALSGFCVLAVSFFGKNAAVICAGVIYFDISSLLFLFMLALTLIAGAMLTMLLKRRKEKFFTLILRKGDRSVRLSALLDSGNLLRDPYDGSEVIVADTEAVGQIFTGGFRLLPYSSLGTQNGLIRAYKADSAEIVETGKIMRNVTVAVSDRKLSKNKRIQALIGESTGEDN